MRSVQSVLELTLVPTAEEAHRACSELRAVLQSRMAPAVASSRLFGIELAAREAVQNAVDYGSGGNVSQRIRLSAQWDVGVLRLVVSDEGPGFDVADVVAKELASEPGTSGNGIRIIAAYADRYEYRDGGRTLVIDFNLGEGNLMQDLPSSGMWVPNGNLIAASAHEAKEALRALVAGSAGEFVIDLSAVGMIDSKGLGILIATVNSLEATGRTLRIIGANSDLVELFRLMRLDRHLKLGPGGA